MRRIVLLLALSLACSGSTEPTATNLTGTWRDPVLPVSQPFVFVLTDRAGAITGTASGGNVSYTVTGTYDGHSTLSATLVSFSGARVAFASDLAFATAIAGRLNGGGYTDYPIALSKDP